tara:strand:- start:407 stop:601 length:195 start_codon:yes stop_codon:yes gene_type:complete
MRCLVCHDTGQIEREIRVVKDQVRVLKIFDWGEDWCFEDRDIELGGIDACPSCTRIAEIEWRLP